MIRTDSQLSKQRIGLKQQLFRCFLLTLTLSKLSVFFQTLPILITMILKNGEPSLIASLTHRKIRKMMKGTD